MAGGGLGASSRRSSQGPCWSSASYAGTGDGEPSEKAVSGLRLRAGMRHRIMRVVRRAQKTVPFRVLVAFGESQAASYASALAFAGFLAMFPMVLGALSIIGLMIR